MVYALCFGLFLVGLYGVLVKRNILKIIIGLGIMQAAVIIFIVMLGYNAGGSGDPVARELALVAFLAAAAVVAIAATLARRLRATHGSYDIKDLNRFKE